MLTVCRFNAKVDNTKCFGGMPLVLHTELPYLFVFYTFSQLLKIVTLPFPPQNSFLVSLKFHEADNLQSRHCEQNLKLCWETVNQIFLDCQDI